MALSISTAARNAAADGVTGLLNIGGAGVIEIRSGAKPATPGDAATGTLLATLTLSTQAFAAAVNGVSNLNTVASVTAAASGTAGWFRAKSGAGTAVFDGVCGTSGADLNLASVSITAGGSVSITAGQVTAPGS